MREIWSFSPTYPYLPKLHSQPPHPSLATRICACTSFSFCLCLYLCPSVSLSLCVRLVSSPLLFSHGLQQVPMMTSHTVFRSGYRR
ncbi:hypothetical protein LX32DRAFT_200387 [Colletotrichum zoysiae]|uniref:Uncharacterized protein n=1 Tax=Colletotrichum zoysiae TaxID=1216348 RepID=A0AAD9H4K3_9PEZI|nr:hypothetical protein LX32DRAFT_200387 [Colletotrichum zoysiae]